MKMKSLIIILSLLGLSVFAHQYFINGHFFEMKDVVNHETVGLVILSFTAGIYVAYFG
jgi:hypothetical protein